MSEHLSLETCRRLAKAGYPQGEWPQMVWNNYSDGALLEYAEGNWNDPYDNMCADYYACPPIITPNGTGGVLPWLSARGLYWECYLLADGLTRWGFHGEDEAYLSPGALIAAALDALEARQ